MSADHLFAHEFSDLYVLGIASFAATATLETLSVVSSLKVLGY